MRARTYIYIYNYTSFETPTESVFFRIALCLERVAMLAFSFYDLPQKFPFNVEPQVTLREKICRDIPRLIRTLFRLELTYK